MTNDKITPHIYDWYLDLRDDRSFMVIYFDEDEGLVEIQYFDGETAEFDLEEWEDMSLEEIEQPDDWTGTIDGLEQDDMGF